MKEAIRFAGIFMDIMYLLVPLSVVLIFAIGYVLVGAQPPPIRRVGSSWAKSIIDDKDD